MDGIAERNLFSSDAIRQQIRVLNSDLESIERVLWQICLQLATEREAAEVYRAYCIEVMEEQRQHTRTLLATNEAVESDRKAVLARLQSGFHPLGSVSLMDPPPEQFSQGRQPQADGIPRDADGKPIPLE